MKPKLKLTLVEQKGQRGCHHGHRVGDVFRFEGDRDRLCPMAMHAAFPYLDIIRYGGTPPAAADGTIKFCCPDSDVINVFRIEEDTP